MTIKEIVKRTGKKDDLRRQGSDEEDTVCLLGPGRGVLVVSGCWGWKRHFESLKLTMLSINAWHVFVKNLMSANFSFWFEEEESPVGIK